MDISDGFVWVVQDRVQGVPVVASVHTDKSAAWEAALEYMGDDRTRFFSVNPMKLNQLNQLLTTQGAQRWAIDHVLR